MYDRGSIRLCDDCSAVNRSIHPSSLFYNFGVLPQPSRRRIRPSSKEDLFKNMCMDLLLLLFNRWRAILVVSAMPTYLQYQRQCCAAMTFNIVSQLVVCLFFSVFQIQKQIQWQKVIIQILHNKNKCT